MKQDDDYYNAWPNAQRSWHERRAVSAQKACYSKRDYQMERKNEKGALYVFLYLESS